MHLLLLAQSTPPAAALASWLEVLFYFGGFIAMVLGGLVALKSLRAPEPAQPLEVREHPGHVVKADIDQIHGRIKREREEVEAKLDRLEEEDRRQRDRHDQDMKQLNERIDHVPQRTIELLKDTKGLI